MNTATYLVLEPIEIIASDLAMNVQDYDPLARVLIALTPDEGCRAVQGMASVRVAFVHCDPVGFSTTALGRILAALGATLVFTGDAAERTRGETLVLHRPYCAAATTDLLLRTVKTGHH